MKQHLTRITLQLTILSWLFFTPANLIAWGFFAHQKINRLAVFCLPKEIFSFYKQHIEYITEHAVDPDKRRYLLEGEGVKHFIDLDYYEKTLPFDTIPKFYHLAIAKYSHDTLHTYGISPWNIQWMQKSLTDAFLEKDVNKILKYSAEIGHYLGDAHVPLHTTSNYNGQKTGQQGIHGFFESRLPELFSVDYDFFLGTAAYIDNPLELSWKIIGESYSCLDSVFEFEKQLHNSFPDPKIYGYEPRGNSLQRVYSKEFSEAYHKYLNGMVQRRMRASILNVASFWYTAWVNAGQPNLETMAKTKPDTIENRQIKMELLPDKMIGRQEN